MEAINTHLLFIIHANRLSFSTKTDSAAMYLYMHTYCQMNTYVHQLRRLNENQCADAQLIHSVGLSNIYNFA